MTRCGRLEIEYWADQRDSVGVYRFYVMHRHPSGAQAASFSGSFRSDTLPDARTVLLAAGAASHGLSPRQAAGLGRRWDAAKKRSDAGLPRASDARLLERYPDRPSTADAWTAEAADLMRRELDKFEKSTDSAQKARKLAGLLFEEKDGE